MNTIQLRSPSTPEEVQQYYELRWRILRAPWKQPRGSERDEWEDTAEHIAAFNHTGILVGVGRLHKTSIDHAQIRYMAIEEHYRGQGIGHALYSHLENLARNANVKSIHVHARLPVVGFYEHMGFRVIGEGPTLFGEIRHKHMEKLLQGLNYPLSQG